MIALDLSYSCDAPNCGLLTSLPLDAVLAGSEREQYVRVGSALPAGWTLGTDGAHYCPAHACDALTLPSKERHAVR